MKFLQRIGIKHNINNKNTNFDAKHGKYVKLN